MAPHASGQSVHPEPFLELPPPTGELPGRILRVESVNKGGITPVPRRVE